MIQISYIINYITKLQTNLMKEGSSSPLVQMGLLKALELYEGKEFGNLGIRDCFSPLYRENVFYIIIKRARTLSGWIEIGPFSMSPRQRNGRLILGLGLVE